MEGITVNGKEYSSYEVSTMWKLTHLSAELSELAKHSKNESVLRQCEKVLRELNRLHFCDFEEESKPEYEPFRSEYLKCCEAINSWK